MMMNEASDHPSPVIQISEMTKHFGATMAVDHVSFDVARGEIFGLLGPNGAGKTTTIQLILGLTTPTSGRIRVLGLDLRRFRRRILQRVNFSSAYVQLPPNLTVKENLTVFGKLYGIRRPGRAIRHWLEFFDIGHTLNMRTGMLSTGQLTRLNLAKALLNDPEILFLDEPTASLDPEIAARVRDLLCQINASRGVSIIYTSHNMNEVELMCDRVLFVSRGRVVLEGTPADIKQRAMAGTLEEVFIRIARDGALQDYTGRGAPERRASLRSALL